MKGWKKGDRVCPNFNIGHLFGDPTPETVETGLGGQIDGVLREYLALPAEVSSSYEYLEEGRRMTKVICVVSCSYPRSFVLGGSIHTSVSLILVRSGSY